MCFAYDLSSNHQRSYFELYVQIIMQREPPPCTKQSKVFTCHRHIYIFWGGTTIVLRNSEAEAPLGFRVPAVLPFKGTVDYLGVKRPYRDKGQITVTRFISEHTSGDIDRGLGTCTLFPHITRERLCMGTGMCGGPYISVVAQASPSWDVDHVSCVLQCGSPNTGAHQSDLKGACNGTLQ